MLQGMNDRLTETGRCFRMEVNMGKTKVMIISKESSRLQIIIEEKQLENVECIWV